MKLHDYLWIFPFISFAFGYSLVSFFFSSRSIEVPSLIGKNINHVVHILSQSNLNLRINAQKEDLDLPNGTIVSQNPKAGNKIKSNQAIYCVTSRKPQALIAPNFVGQTIEHIDQFVKKENIRINQIFLESKYPANICIGQVPAPGSNLEQKSFLTYISSPHNTKVIFPNLQGSLIPEVVEFLTLHNLNPDIFHKSKQDAHHQCLTCKVLNQKPLPGSIVDLSKPINIQLQVR